MTYFSEIVHLSDIARVHGDRCPDKKAFVFEDRVVTYKEFNTNSEKVANGLVLENVAEQDRIAYMDKNSDRFYELVMGCAKSNSVIVGINWRLAPPEVAYILNDSSAKILFVGEDFFGLVEKILKDVPSIEKVICMSGTNKDIGKSIIKAVLERNPIGFLEAMVFGVISPAIKTSKVITIVDNADPAVSSPSRKLTNRIVEREAINILTKLFATRIPPIVCSRSSLAFFILLFLFESES